MDLGAYANIDDLDEIAKKNNIEVPRLRGYRLMKEEEPIDIKKEVNEAEIAIDCIKNLCESEPFWNPHSSCYSMNSWTDYLKDFYLVHVGHDYLDIRWDRIHGQKRRILKTYIHNEIVRARKQYEVWNKYAGREDILYIHARIGGGNWKVYYRQVVDKPWFLEKVDDSFDSTYCDIYARLKDKLKVRNE